MIRVPKLILYALAAALGLLLALALAALITVRTPWFREKVRARIIAEIEKATGGRVELRQFDFDWRALRAGVRGLTIRGTEGVGQPPLFQADAVEVGLKIVSAFKRDVDIELLAVRRPRVNLIVYPDGRTNVPAPRVRRPGKGAVEQILALAVRRFVVEAGEVRVEARKYSLNFRGEDFRATFLYETGRPRYIGDFKFGVLWLRPGPRESLPLAVEARLAIERNRLDVVAARVGWRNSDLRLSGAVENFAAPQAELTYAAGLRLDQVASVLHQPGFPERGEVTIGGRALIAGGAAYRVTGTLRGAGITFRQRGVLIQGARLNSEMELTPERIVLRDLAVSALGGRFNGRAEIALLRELRLEGLVQEFSIASLARAAEARGSRGAALKPVPWGGVLSGPVVLSARLSRGALRDVNVRTQLAVRPAPGPNPLNGSLELSYEQRKQEVSFGPSWLATASSRVEFQGVLGRNMEVTFETTDVGDIEAALALVPGRRVEPLPLQLKNGRARFHGVVTGPIADPRLAGRVSLASFAVGNRLIDSLEADVAASCGEAAARNIDLRKPGLTLSGSGRIALRDWKPADDAPVSASLSIRADAGALLAEAGRTLPVSGALRASVNVSGELAKPAVAARVALSKGAIYDQPIDHAEADLRYKPGLLEVSSASAQSGANRLQMAGSFAHPEGKWDEGRLHVRIATPSTLLKQLKPLQQRLPGVDGQIKVNLAGEIEFSRSGFRVGWLDGEAAVRQLAVDGKPVGDLTLTAATAGPLVKLDLHGEAAGAAIEGRSEWRLEGDYPVRGTLRFSRMQLATLLARLRPGSPLPLHGFAEGKVDFSGSTLEPQGWRAVAELGAFEMRPNAARTANGAELVLRNEGPVTVEIDAKRAQVRRAQFRGKETEISVTGNIAFGAKEPWDLRVRGTLNLALLRDFVPRISSAGRLELDASLRGPLARPDVYGQLRLQNASLNHPDFPNGIDKANGLIFLYRDRATIETLTGETGGGKFRIGGFIGLGPVITFSLDAKAEQVRVRYPEGVSTTLNASLTLTGSPGQSVLGGEVVVARAAFNPQTDLGSLLAATSQPMPVPESPSRLLQGMRFDVHIETSAQARFETTLARSLQVEADLRLRGDPIRPALLGHVLISQGEVMFFGNRYNIDSGEVIFVNPAKIEPLLNLHLQTRVRGIEVALNVNGPLAKPNVTYRSDPPLPFSDIVALLATGSVPNANTPGLVGARSELSQSWEQAGASALVSQAIANPLASRLQRFFGVSRLKIDPGLTGAENTPEARLTLEQQITPTVTFTYITNLSRAQQQTIRVEWDFTRNFSAVALREANGAFGVDFLYKKRFK